MKKVTVKINKRNLTGLINKTSFKYSGGMFTPYAFIAVDFDTEKSNTAKFYESVQVNSNSWTNYPGTKIWDNNQEDWKRSEVLERCEETLIGYVLPELELTNPEINFKLVGF